MFIFLNALTKESSVDMSFIQGIAFSGLHSVHRNHPIVKDYLGKIFAKDIRRRSLHKRYRGGDINRRRPRLRVPGFLDSKQE